MKKFISLAIAAIVTLGSYAQSASSKNCEQFSSVNINAPVRVVIVPGRTHSVSVVSEVPELTSAVSWNVRKGVLNVNARDLESLERSDASVSVIVTSPNAVDHSVAQGMEQVSYTQKRLFPRPAMAHAPLAMNDAPTLDPLPRMNQD